MSSKLNICIATILFFLLSLSLMAYATGSSNNWENYEKIWIKRNPSARLDILKRAISHYLQAKKEYSYGNLKEAERFSKDALKVVPEFKEALALLSKIYLDNDNKEKYKKTLVKYKYYLKSLSPLTEYNYLNANIERLSNNYSPSLFFNKIIIFFIAVIVFSLVFFLIYIMNGFFYIKMFFLSLFINKKNKKELESEELKKIIIKKFPGDDN